MEFGAWNLNFIWDLARPPQAGSGAWDLALFLQLHLIDILPQICYILFMVMAIQEKRQNNRIRLNIPISYQVRGQGQAQKNHTKDISAGGLSFVSENFLAPSTNINMEIGVYDKVMSPVGSIAWTTPIPHSNRYRIGVRFAEFNPRDKEYLSDYIRILSDRLL